jgi:hypothetical protein
MVRVNTERVERAMRERGLSIVRLARRAHMTYHGCWSCVAGLPVSGSTSWTACVVR